MKLRLGFVTNSSSTSFIISFKDEINKTNFLKALKMDSSSPLAFFAAAVFQLVSDRMKDFTQVLEKNAKYCPDPDENLRDICGSAEVFEIVSGLLKAGRKVYTGSFWDDNYNYLDAYLCNSSFFINNDDIFFVSEDDCY